MTESRYTATNPATIGLKSDGPDGAGNTCRGLTATARIDSTEGAIMAETKTTEGLIRCGGCPARWGAFGAAHCAACHVTFSTAGNFDRHRASFECREPASVGLVLNERGSWGEAPAEGGHSHYRQRKLSGFTPVLGVVVPGGHLTTTEAQHGHKARTPAAPCPALLPGALVGSTTHCLLNRGHGGEHSAWYGVAR